MFIHSSIHPKYVLIPKLKVVLIHYSFSNLSDCAFIPTFNKNYSFVRINPSMELIIRVLNHYLFNNSSTRAFVH